MSEQTENEAPQKGQARANRATLLIVAGTALAITTLLLALILIKIITPSDAGSPSLPALDALREHIFSQADISSTIAASLQNSPLDGYVVFLSLCNGQDRARVIKGSGSTLEEAWQKAADTAKQWVAANHYQVVWAKADLVNSAEEIPTVDLNKEVVENYYRYFFRKGIAFDKNFDIAFLEGELNGNKMITYYTENQLANNEVDYNSVLLHLDNINYYLKNYYGLDELKSIPDKIITFTTLGFFCDADGQVYDLYNEGLNTGRRVIAMADDKVVEPIITTASRYLYNLIQPDGRFIYGYYPIFDNELQGYNILRHASSIWSLINLYRMTHDEELLPKMQSAIDYLLTQAMEYRDADTAYIIDRDAGEVKLGGNGVAIIMLTEYMDVFKTDQYVGIVRALANGILALEDPSSGTYYHVLNYPGFTPKEAYRTVYYDGEATFALTRAYTYTQEQKYLDGAIAAVENFIDQDYTVYQDHWVAYALNELTKYVSDPRYYEFAMRNVQENLDEIYHQPTSYHTYLELLMAGWQTYERMLQNGIHSPYLDAVDAQYFAETIYKRAFHMLNAYFYPEFAMYMKKPERIVGSFFVRHDDFRVRIDDIQHFIGGYYYYALYYDQIRSYLPADFLQSINSGVTDTAPAPSDAEMDDDA